MTIQATQTASQSALETAIAVRRNTAQSASESSFAEVVAKQISPAPYTTKQAVDFFRGSPTHHEIANKAVALRLNKQQIVDAMASAGYENRTPEELSAGIDKFLSANSDAYGWGVDGTLMSRTVMNTASSVALSKNYQHAREFIAQNAGTVKSTDRISTGFGWGKHFTVGEARAFFSTNPDDIEILALAAGFNMSDEELATTLAYGRGDAYNALDANAMVNNSNRFGFDREGHIVELNGSTKRAQNGNSMLTLYDTPANVAGAAALGGTMHTTA
ncbi:MAG TPA: hypothetical protein PLL01_06415 [Rhodoferax sp.]|jgi:hypothetical protein|nr:hypothetical protein [Rhodoferax sp.]